MIEKKNQTVIKSLTNADVKVADPNWSGGDGRLTDWAWFLSIPSLLPKPTNGTTGIPVLYREQMNYTKKIHQKSFSLTPLQVSMSSLELDPDPTGMHVNSTERNVVWQHSKCMCTLFNFIWY